MIGTSRATSSLALFDGPRALDVACLGIGARVERERDALARAIARAAADSGYLHSFVPDAVLELEEAFASAVGARHALGLASGTAALHVALAVCGVRAGDEVVTTPYTWPQVISPILDRLAVPVFADIDPDTYTLAPTSIEAAITERTRAILAVHQFGHAADMTRIREIARSQNLRIIEDAAQAFGATWNGSPVGIHGDVACFSLGLTKLVSGLEGGVLVTNDTQLFERAVALTQHPARVFAEGVDDSGSDGIHPSSRLHPLAAVLALEALREIRQRLAARCDLAARLGEALDHEVIRPVYVDPRAGHSFYRYSPTFEPGGLPGISRETFIEALAAEGVPIAPGYVGRPIHLLPTLSRRCYAFAPLDPWLQGGSPRTYGPGDCPMAERRCLQTDLGIDFPEVESDGWLEGVALAIVKIRSNADCLRDLQAERAHFQADGSVAFSRGE